MISLHKHENEEDVKCLIGQITHRDSEILIWLLAQFLYWRQSAELMKPVGLSSRSLEDMTKWSPGLASVGEKVA